MPAILALFAILAYSTAGPKAEAAQAGNAAAAPVTRQATAPVVVTKRFTRTSYDRSLRCPRARGAVQKFFDDVYAQQISCGSPTYRGRSVSRNKWLFLASQNDEESYDVTRILISRHRYVFRVVCREAPRPDFGSAPPSDFVPCRLKATALAAQAANQTAAAASTEKKVDSQDQQSSALTCADARISAYKAFRRYSYAYAIKRARCHQEKDVSNVALLFTRKWDYTVLKKKVGVPFVNRRWEDSVTREVHVIPLFP